MPTGVEPIEIDVLTEAASKIGGIRDPIAKKRYAQALASSLTFDISGQHNPVRVMSPDMIRYQYGISTNDQDYHRISIRRGAIKKCLAGYGRIVTSSEISLYFKSQAYEQYFQREISKCGNGTDRSPTLYTYAEAFQRLGINIQISVPPEVEALFHELGIVFPVLNNISGNDTP